MSNGLDVCLRDGNNCILLQAKTYLTKSDNSAIKHEDNIFNGYNGICLKKCTIVLIKAVSKRNIYSFESVLLVMLGGRIIKNIIYVIKTSNQKDDGIWFHTILYHQNYRQRYAIEVGTFFLDQ